MRILSWNVQRPGKDRASVVVDAIVDSGAEVVMLQEANPRVCEGLAASGWPHQVSGYACSYPSGARDVELTHGALIASRYDIEPDISWTKAACYPTLFARGTVASPIGAIDLVTAHIPNGASNGWRKVDHLRLLGRILREAPPSTRVVTGDFNEPQAVLADGRVVGFGADVNDDRSLNVRGEVTKGTEGLDGPFPYREWDRAVADLFAPTHHGLTHFLVRQRGSLRPMPVTHETSANPRFFDHAFVSEDLEVSGRYEHELRRSGASDHSALVLDLEKATPRGFDDWETS